MPKLVGDVGVAKVPQPLEPVWLLSFEPVEALTEFGDMPSHYRLALIRVLKRPSRPGINDKMLSNSRLSEKLPHDGER